MYEFYLGIDLTDERKEAVLTLVEKSTRDEDGASNYRVHRIEPVQPRALDEPLPEHIASLIAGDPYVGRTIIVVNTTEQSGEELLERLQDAGQPATGIVLGGGDFEVEMEEGLMASEHDVVQSVEELYHDGRLRLEDEKTEGASLLARGLQSYRARAHEAGDALESITAEPRRNADYASFVLSAGIACWVGEERRFDPTEHLAPPAIGEAKRRMRPDTTRSRSKRRAL